MIIVLMLFNRKILRKLWYEIKQKENKVMICSKLGIEKKKKTY